MGVCLNLTAIAPELMDSVIYMDNSPAYAAFKAEIEAIIADFNSTGKISSNWQIDAADLTAKSEETMKNMHRAFLFWTFDDERKGTPSVDVPVKSYQKLFFKTFASELIALNGGKEMIDVTAVKEYINSVKIQISSDSALFEKMKEYFLKYIYGSSFNYLDEQKVMRKYAEKICYQGVMTGKINASVAEQQKMMPKMMRLNDNRLIYISGFVPLDLMLEAVYTRIDFSAFSDKAEADKIKAKIKAYITSNYKTEKDEDVDFVSDDVMTSFLSSFFGKYINVPQFSKDLYLKSFSGVRTFLDADRDDTGDYNSAKLVELTGVKCTSDFNGFFSSENAPVNDTSLGGDDISWKYPVVYKENSDYWFAPCYEEFVYPVLDREIYTAQAVPSGMFPFADNALKSNNIRQVSGSSDSTVTIRKDRMSALEKLKKLEGDSSLSERDRKALMLEQMLVLVSGNVNEAKYKALITENVMGTDLYETYIRYRMDVLVNQALTGLEAKKQLLDSINRI